jgi:hypothetical protein
VELLEVQAVGALIVRLLVELEQQVKVIVVPHHHLYLEVVEAVVLGLLVRPAVGVLVLNHLLLAQQYIMQVVALDLFQEWSQLVD